MTWFLAMTFFFAGFLTPLSATPSSPSAGLLLVANKGDRTLKLIDPDSGRQAATILEGGVTGHEVVASPDGKRTFVPIYGDSGVGLPGTDGSTMDVIDLSQRKVIQTIDFGHGVRPHCPVFGPKDGLLYVTTELDKSVTIIDPHSLKIVGSVPTGQAESHKLAISPARQQPPDRIQRQRASAFRPRLRGHQPQLPGPHRRACSCACRYQGSPGPA